MCSDRQTDRQKDGQTEIRIIIQIFIINATKLSKKSIVCHTQVLQKYMQPSSKSQNTVQNRRFRLLSAVCCVLGSVQVYYIPPRGSGVSWWPKATQARKPGAILCGGDDDATIWLDWIRPRYGLNKLCISQGESWPPKYIAGALSHQLSESPHGRSSLCPGTYGSSSFF